MPTTIMIDMRCLQDLQHAERGIQSHARCIISEARTVSSLGRGARLIGLTDPTMSPLPAPVRTWLDAVVPLNKAEPGPDRIFISPAPLSFDNAVFTSFLNDQTVLKIAAVYDFIPLDAQLAYLSDPGIRYHYLCQLSWLQKFDHFIAISDPTAARLAEIWPAASACTTVSGVALPASFTPGPAGTPRHILVVAGGVGRKNPEVTICAHARTPALQDRGIELVIIGHYPEAEKAEMKRLAVREGGDPTLLRITGRVPDEILRAAYSEAFCVVTPSYAEGFSMPVIEAMAAGVPAVGSNIPAHAALIHDPELRFAPDDVTRLSSLITRMVMEPAWRSATVSAQSEVWPAFTKLAVATRFWRDIEAAADKYAAGSAPTPELPPETERPIRHRHAPAKATILIDMRCLQEPAYAERGIAVHSRSAILLAREVSTFCRDARIIGIIDPTLPPLPEAVAAVADEIRTNAYMPDLTGPVVLLNPAPMTTNQDFIGRLLLDKTIRKATIVYDFIPFDAPHWHLVHNAAYRLDYYTSMLWLRHYDAFLPISEDTSSRTRSLFDLTGRPAIVTGVPLAPWLEGAAATAQAPRHILCVAGDDPRKNPELLVRAHAESRILQERRIRLIITGNYRPQRQADFRVMAMELGGDPTLLTMPGRVSQEALLDQYRHAWCVVTASRAEGFSIPVIEAMAAGVPSIVSDIPVHAALVIDPALRFDPDDNLALQNLLERMCTDPAFRAATIAAQTSVWQPYRAATVAEKIWGTVERLAASPLAAPLVGGRRPRLAILTPLPPRRSGVADYSAALAKNFSDRADVSLFSNARAPGVGAISGFAHMAPQFDRVVSVMGNSSEHSEIYECLQRFGGACICHDARLLGFFIAGYGLDFAARMAGRELGRHVSPEEIMAWDENESQRQTEFFSTIAQAALPLIFHTEHSVNKLRSKTGKVSRYLPFAIYRPWDGPLITAASRRAARDRLGIPQEETVIASFGFIHAIKGIELAIRALALLNGDGIAAHLYWIGATAQDLDGFQQLAETLRVADRVHFLDRFVNESAYRDYLLAADFGLQLRLGGLGNISGALADCIAAGLPSVASDDLAENVKAPSFIKRVPDRPQPHEISNAIRELMDAGAAHALWTEERIAYCARYSMRNYANGLLEILEL